MKTRLNHLWDNLSSSYWFAPAVMVASVAVLALVMLWIDRHWHAPVASAWIYTGGAAGARALLSTVAGSVMTVAGVVFSITIATLTQASSQFGPRLLRNFMRDLGNQIVLGTFVATFIYCLLILRAVRGLDDALFVPNLSVTVAVLMAVGSLAVLIYFIDHISRSLQGPQVVASVGIELERAIVQPFPAGAGVECDNATTEGREADSFDVRDARVIVADASGYLQAMDEDGLLEFARQKDWLLRLACRPGDYIIKGSSLLRIETTSADEQTRCELAKLFFLGRQRTAEQDVEYSIRQLVEIAVRALSPGINDPFTAMNCLDWLGAALAAVAVHGLPSPIRCDFQGRRRLIVRVSTFAGLADAAFNQIRQFSEKNVAVSMRLLEVIAAVARHLKMDQHRSVLRRHLEMIIRQSNDGLTEPGDLADVQSRYELAVQALGVPGAG